MTKHGLTNPGNDGDWVVVAYVTNRLEADVIASMLRAFEIPVFVQQEAAGRAIGITLGALGMIRVLVPIAFEADAFALLEEDDPDDPNTLLDEPPLIFPDDYPNEETGE